MSISKNNVNIINQFQFQKTMSKPLSISIEIAILDSNIISNSKIN